MAKEEGYVGGGSSCSPRLRSDGACDEAPKVHPLDMLAWFGVVLGHEGDGARQWLRSGLLGEERTV